MASGIISENDMKKTDKGENYFYFDEYKNLHGYTDVPSKDNSAHTDIYVKANVDVFGGYPVKGAVSYDLVKLHSDGKITGTQGNQTIENIVRELAEKNGFVVE